MIRKTKTGQSSGLKFDGANDVVDLVVGVTPFNFAYTDDFSISNLVKVNDFTNLNGFITNRGLPIFYLAGVFDNGKIFLITENLSGEIYATSDSYFEDLINGCHIVFTRTGNGGGGAIYINGVSVSIDFVDLGAKPTDNVSAYHSIGSNFGTNFLNGEIHHFSIFNKVLNQAEVSEIYNTECKNIPLTAQANLLANYEFNDSQGFIAKDSSGNGYNGDLANYTIPNTTIGATNSWVYRNGQPFDNSQYSIIGSKFSIGDGLKIIGDNDYYVQLPFIPTINQWTVTFYIKKTDTISPFFPVFGVQTLISGINITNLLGINENGISLWGTLLVNKPLINGKYYFFAFIYDGSSLTGIIDDIYGTPFLTANPLFNNSPRLGSRGDGIHNLQQNIHDLKIFDKVLNQSEIQELYLKRGQTVPLTAQANLIAIYLFNQKQGFVLIDSSGNGLNGNLINYTVGDTTLGVNNLWRNQNDNPITQL